jgi:hypothetical protein
MSTAFGECAETVGRLFEAVTELERAGEMLQLSPLAGREWFKLVRQKLLPQLRDEAFLIAAVVGGTNIGKSVVFNHLADEIASATSPLASGTKHPVCLIPPRFADQHDLASLFDGFELQEWTDANAALVDHAEHQLFWRVSTALPENLLLLDTPDIDSDAQINWERAEHIRRAADVLIAVLTQQKYNDAAVKRFFRQAAEEDKAVIVVFNQCQFPEDDAYWPLWLETFSRETGVRPEIVYIAPNDRPAAEERRLPFYERPWPTETDTVEQLDTATDEPRNLREDLSRLKFEDVKLRSLRGSLKILSSEDVGVPSWLHEIERRSADVRSTAARLSTDSVVRLSDWPTIPNPLLVREIRSWWKARQQGWAKRINTTYDTVGAGITWPFRMAGRALNRAESVSPFESLHKQEWSAVQRAIEEIIDKLTWMSEAGSNLLRPRFEALLTGDARVRLIRTARSEHDACDLEAELHEAVDAEMQMFRQDSPESYRFYRQLNNVAAAVRPMTSVVLFTLGWGPAGEVVAPMVANAATQAVVHVVADFAGGTGAAVAGETAIATAARSGAGFLEAKFRRLQAAFTTRRVDWLAALLKRELFGSLPEDLQAAANLSESEEFGRVVALLNSLAESAVLRQDQTPSIPTNH